MKFDLKVPCDNCPFRKEGAIALEPGRLSGIVTELEDDHKVFQCHKYVHGPKGGEWKEDLNGNERYIRSGNEQACMGALAYMFRLGYVPVLLRLQFMMKGFTKSTLTKLYPLLKEKAE